MLIDLTGDEEEEVQLVRELPGGIECPICMHSVAGGVTYCCCAQFACLACFRRMHCGASARFMDDCPFCRAPVSAQMDLLLLHWRCGDGSQGSLCAYPGDPLARLRVLLPLGPAWPKQRYGMLRIAALQLESSRQVLALDETPLYMSALAHGDRVNVLFEFKGGLIY